MATGQWLTVGCPWAVASGLPFGRILSISRVISWGVARWFPQRAKSVHYVRAFWKRRSEERVARKAGRWALALAGGVARWPRGPSLWRAGWQGGQEGPRSGGPDGTVAKRALVLAGGVAR